MILGSIIICGYPNSSQWPTPSAGWQACIANISLLTKQACDVAMMTQHNFAGMFVFNFWYNFNGPFFQRIAHSEYSAVNGTYISAIFGTFVHLVTYWKVCGIPFKHILHKTVFNHFWLMWCTKIGLVYIGMYKWSIIKMAETVLSHLKHNYHFVKSVMILLVHFCTIFGIFVYSIIYQLLYRASVVIPFLNRQSSN